MCVRARVSVREKEQDTEEGEMKRDRKRQRVRRVKNRGGRTRREEGESNKMGHRLKW